MQLALAEIAAGETAAARSRVERLATAHPACEPCDQLLGEIALRQGRSADAASHFERALERTVEPKSTLMRIRLARIARDPEAFRAVAASLDREVAVGVDVWFPAWLLALVSAELGDDERALRWHEEARNRGYLDWRADLAEPAFAELRRRGTGGTAGTGGIAGLTPAPDDPPPPHR